MTSQNNSPVRRSPCPIAFGLDLFGDKWTLLVLRDLLFYNKSRFSDFAVHERIATNVLADRLARLEQAGVITKAQDTELKNQNIYRVTDKGRDLLPTLIEMSLWGMRYDAPTPVSKEFLRSIEKDEKQVVAEMTQAIESGTFEEYRIKAIGVDPKLLKINK